MNLRKKVALTLGWVVSIMVVSVVLYSYIFDVQNEPDGFGGIMWASNIRDLPDMKLLAEDGDFTFYVREGEEMKLRDIDVDKIVYGFYKGRFYNAMIYYSSPEKFSAIKDMFVKHHGTPYQPDQSLNKYFWAGNVTNLLLTYDEASNEGRISYFFQEIENEIEAREKAKSGEAEKNS